MESIFHYIGYFFKIIKDMFLNMVKNRKGPCMKKKKIVLLMCVIMSFLLCACGKAQDVEESQSSESTVGNQETATEIKEQTTVEDVIPKEPESTEAPVEPAKEDC